MSTHEACDVAHDLSHPDYNPLDCPQWAREEVPRWVLPSRGVNGLPDGLRRHFSGANALATAGVDRYQANQFITYCAETAAWLYTGYTPMEVEWPEGYLPTLRRLALEVTTGARSPEEKALRLLHTVSRRLLHPCVPPIGDAISGDRNLDEEALIASGTAWCNEQSRVFVRLCQAAGLPARLVHYFYSEFPAGHTVVEFHDGQRWCLTDVTYGVVFRGPDGQLLSTADCMGSEDGQALWQRVMDETVNHTLRLGRHLLAQGSALEAESQSLALRRTICPELNRRLHTFAVMNYPLPGTPAASRPFADSQ